MMRWIVRNWFVVGLVSAVSLAFAFPAPGASDGWLRATVTTKFAVAAIFFSQGLILPREALRTGLTSWRLHGFVQLFVFLLFPVFGLLFDTVFRSAMPSELRQGFLFLAVLPTTISSAIVLTSLAGGNTSGALVNCTFSNLIGVVVTPLWIGLLLEIKGQVIAFWPLVQGMAVLVIVPLGLGQVARVFWRSWADRRKVSVRNTGSGLILFLVYAAFCDSALSGLWNQHGWAPVAWGIGGVALLLAVSTTLVIPLARAAGLRPSDQTAAFFCGTQKTLAAGVPMAKLVFAAHPGFAMILVPLMFYHALQLLVGGMMVGLLRRRSHEEAS